MKKVLVVVLLISLLSFSLMAITFAHPPVSRDTVTLPSQAAGGMHKACENLDPEGIAYHVHFFLLSPHAME